MTKQKAAPVGVDMAEPRSARRSAGADHSRQLPRLRRVEGQVRGIAAMVEDGRYCVDILTQLQAARAALARVEREILDAHVGACVTDAVGCGDTEATRIKLVELTELLRRALR